MRRSNVQPMTPLDYAVMFGGPLAFILVAVLGILWILGPPPPKNPVELVKKEAVHSGMTKQQVEDVLGAPKDRIAQPDGGEVWRYHHGTADPFVEEDADLTFGPSGTLINSNVSRSNVPVPGQDKDKKGAILSPESAV